MESQYAESAALRDKQFDDSQKLLGKLGDSSLTKEQRQKLIQEGGAKEKESVAAHLKKQAGDNKAYGEKQRAKLKEKLNAARAAKAAAQQK